MIRRVARRLSGDASDLLTPPGEAIKEILARRKNPALIRRVEEYLHGDIPRYLKGSKPVLHLARHVAAPSFETLRFVELGRPFNLPIVVSQDPKDKFVSNNSLKRALGKMPVVKGVSSDGHEIVEYFTVVDFSKDVGKSFRNIKTSFGISLVKFQNKLLREIYPKEVKIVTDSAWIDRHHRGNLIEHYKEFLALMVVHGVMFESYVDEDALFVKEILRPAFKFIKKKFGVKPLICNLVEKEILYTRDWYSYPSVLYKYIKGAGKG